MSEPDLNELMNQQKQKVETLMDRYDRGMAIMINCGAIKSMSEMFNTSKEGDTNADVEERLLVDVDRIVSKMSRKDLEDFFTSSCQKVFRDGIRISENLISEIGSALAGAGDGGE